jgi:hypothetical protein
VTYEPPAPPPPPGGAHGDGAAAAPTPQPPTPQPLTPQPLTPQPGSAIPAPVGPDVAPPAQRRGRVGLIASLIAAAIVVGCSGCLVGGFLVVRQTAEVASHAGPSVAPSPRPFAKGECIKHSKPVAADRYETVSCKDADRIGEVLDVFAGDEVDAQSCDPRSDQLIVQDEKVVCVRHTGSTHLADAGRGGGVIIPGDCVEQRGAGGEPSEVECIDPRHTGKVVSRVDAVSACSAPAVRSGKLRTRRQPVLCLALGPGLAGPGECVHGDKKLIYYGRVSCSASTATLKVLARRPTPGTCPPATTEYSQDRDGLPRTKVICYQDIKNGGPHA